MQIIVLGLWSWKGKPYEPTRNSPLFIGFDWMMFNTGLRKIFPLKRSIYYHHCLGRGFRSRLSGVKSVRPHLVTKSILFTPLKSNMTNGKIHRLSRCISYFSKMVIFRIIHASFFSFFLIPKKTAIFFQGVQLLVFGFRGCIQMGVHPPKQVTSHPVTVSPLVVFGPWRLDCCKVCSLTLGVAL